MRFPNVGLILVGGSFLLGCGQEAKNTSDTQFEVPPAGYPVSVEESGSDRIDALVRQLVSKRPAPFRSGYPDPPTAVVLANRYCTPEVESAIRSLKQLGPAVFPALVKHLGDDRYSYSDVWAAWLNNNVGDAVVEVLDDGHYTHSGYKARKTPSGLGGAYLSFDAYLRARGAEPWAEWAKDKSRLEIQFDFIDWCIVKENELGYVNEAQREQILENYETARQRMRKEYSEQIDPAIGSELIRSEPNQTSSTGSSRRLPVR